MKCLRCNSEMQENDQLYSILNSRIEKETGTVTHDINNFMPVNVKLCKECGYVELNHAFVKEIPK